MHTTSDHTCTHAHNTCTHAHMHTAPDKTWRVLEMAIKEIHNKNASGLSFEELYRRVIKALHTHTYIHTNTHITHTCQCR